MNIKDCVETGTERDALVKLYEEKHGEMLGWVRHPFVKYTRYPRALDIIGTLESELGSAFEVFDYGCGVGDYGMAFGRMGCSVVFYDFKEPTDFVSFRIEHENRRIDARIVSRGPYRGEHKDLDLLGARPSLAIFGEVLEHVTNPLEILQKFHAAGTKYIFTSSVPYRSDSPTDDYWQERGHLDEARLQQPAMRELLETKYKKIANYGGQANLWKLRS
jgi:hypothetical protein